MVLERMSEMNDPKYRKPFVPLSPEELANQKIWLDQKSIRNANRSIDEVLKSRRVVREANREHTREP